MDIAFDPRFIPSVNALAPVDVAALHISQLFVAMTRARDGLFLLCGDEPGDVISKAIEHFENTAG